MAEKPKGASLFGGLFGAQASALAIPWIIQHGWKVPAAASAVKYLLSFATKD